MKGIIKIFVISLVLFSFLLPVSAEEEEPLTAEEQMEKISNKKKAGSYPVTLYIKEGNQIHETTIMVTVVFNKTIINDKNEEGIDARDFKISTEDAKLLTTDTAISLAEAHAWNLKTGEEVHITSVEIQEVDRFHLKIIFQTEKGTEITVMATVQNVVYLDIKNGEILYESGVSPEFWNHFRTEFLLLLLIPLPFLLIIFLIANNRLKNIHELLWESSEEGTST